MRVDRNRIALGSYHYFRYPLDYFLDTAVELEVSAVELWAAAPHLCLDLISDRELRAIRGQLRERGLRVCCVTPEQCAYPVNLAAEEEGLRQYSIQAFRRAIQAAALLESPLVLATAGCGYFNRPREEAWERSADSLEQLARYAQAHGVRLALETLTPLSSNILNTPEQQREMLKRLPPGSALPMLDIGQMAYMNQDLSRYLAHGPALGHVHLHDSHPNIHMALGDGDLPVDGYIARLEEAGYRGMYAFECNDAAYRQDPRRADRQNAAWLESHNIL